MRIERQTLADTVFTTIKGRIMNADLRPGTRLKQNALCEELGVSSSPVREALNRLTKERLLEAKPHCGWVVRGFDIEEWHEVCEMRAVLETMAGRQACGRITQDQIKQLRQSIDDMCKCLLNGDRDRAVRADIDFHRIVCAASGNQTLAELYDVLTGRPVAFTPVDQEESPAEEAARHRHQHHAIIEAIVAEDRDLVERLIAPHTPPMGHVTN